MEHGENLDEGVYGSGRVNGYGGLAAVQLNELEGAVEVTADLLVDAEDVGSGLGEVLDEGVGVLDHEVAV